jgi:hypothetical protein
MLMVGGIGARRVLFLLVASHEVMEFLLMLFVSCSPLS